MSPLHPHWDATDAKTSPVSQASKPAAPAAKAPASAPRAQTPLAVPRGSPRPAALLGIFLTVAMGGYMFNSQWSLTGQVASNIEVTLSADGFSPDAVTVYPGQMINWTNADTVSHTLEVASPVPGGSPLAKIEIEPGNSASVTIPDQLAYGLYSYATTDAVPLTGQITVMAPPASSAPEAVGGDDNTVSDDAAFGIERNPFTVDASVKSDSTQSLAPAPLIPPRYLATDDAKTDEGELHGGAPLRSSSSSSKVSSGRAPSQPQTGPETWLMAAAALVAFGLSMRKARLAQ